MVHISGCCLIVLWMNIAKAMNGSFPGSFDSVSENLEKNSKNPEMVQKIFDQIEPKKNPKFVVINQNSPLFSQKSSLVMENLKKHQ